MLGCYLIGQPGAGKSTLFREVTQGIPSYESSQPFAHTVYLPEPSGGRPIGAQLGRHHETFPGTDRLSMAVQPDAEAWVRSAPYPVIIGEGDRLATLGFLTALTEACDEGCTILWLDTPQLTARARATRRGSAQTEAWVKGRRSKVNRLTDLLPVVRLDGTLSPELLAVQAIGASPALQALHALVPGL
jgi:hypothetical protein